MKKKHYRCPYCKRIVNNPHEHFLSCYFENEDEGQAV